MSQRIALLGGTRGMGRAMARILAKRGDRVVLLGRDLDDLARSSQDLAIRGGGEALAPARCDLADPTSFAPALDAAIATLGGLDAVVVTAAAFGTQEALASDPEAALRLCTINFANTVAFCERARVRLLAHAPGCLCVFSSVAGDRGRSPVVLYGATKAGLSAYLEGLDHKYRNEGLVTVCVKPGFVHTSMTEGLPAPPFAGTAEGVARRVVRAMDRGRPVVYAPGIWRWVMWIIRRLPRAVMRRVKF